MKDLRVIYDGGEVDKKLDIVLEKALKPFGFSRWASGMEIHSGKRDLAFEKKGKK